jgi:hypothetical protein
MTPSMTLPAILVYDPKEKNLRGGRAVLERSEDMLKALRAFCSVPLHACQDEPLADEAQYLLEDIWTLIERIPPPLPGGDRLILEGSSRDIENAWFEWRRDLHAAEGKAASLRRLQARGVVKLVPVPQAP